MHTLRLAAVLTAAAAFALSGCADANESAGAVASEGLTTCSYPSDGEPARAVDPPETTGVPAAGTLVATIELTAGDIDVTMDRATAPCTVNSFVSLAEQGFYDDTVCHRLVDTGIFILQCGDPSGTGRGGPGYTFNDEVKPGTLYPAGTIAMANSGRDTNGSQFFITTVPTPWLNGHHTIFGEVANDASKAVVDKLDAVATDRSDTPLEPVGITSVEVVK